VSDPAYVYVYASDTARPVLDARNGCASKIPDVGWLGPRFLGGPSESRSFSTLGLLKERRNPLLSDRSVCSATSRIAILPSAGYIAPGASSCLDPSLTARIDKGEERKRGDGEQDGKAQMWGNERE
jgi:hypothetical protein